MVDVLVCIKRVPEASGQVLLTDDAQGIDGRHVGFTVSNHENSAVELAIQVAEATGGRVTLLTVGPAEATDQLRATLALGAHAAIHVVADPAALGPIDVAAQIAAVVAERDADGGFGLVLLGNDAADSGDFQVGIRLAHRLGRPVVNGVTTVRVDGDEVEARGDGPDGEETFRLPLPAVVTVLEGGVEARYPTLKGRMAAKKVEIETRELVGGLVGAHRRRLVLPPPAPSSVQVLGEGPEAAPAVVAVLEKLGVLR